MTPFKLVILCLKISLHAYFLNFCSSLNIFDKCKQDKGNWARDKST